MGSFSTIGGGGGRVLVELSIAEIASKINNVSVNAIAASYFDNLFDVAEAASIIDNANLSADKAASIADNPNITSAKIKAILDTGSLTDADKIAALLDGDSLTADDAATHVNSGIYTNDLMASAFDSSYLAADKAASIFDNVNLSADKAASIFDSSYLSADKAASIFDNANLSVAKLADIFGNANLSNDRATSIFNLMTRTIADLASVFNDADVDAAKAAYVIESTTKDVADLASIFDNANLSADKAASIADNANLSEAKLQAILDNTNLSIQKGQEIVDAMSNPTKIGTGGRRGYIGDDWEDNKLSSRDKAATVATSFDKIFQTFRPEWTVKAGTITVASGRVEGDAAGINEVQTSSSITEGTWEVDIIILATGSHQLICIIYQDDNNFYEAGNTTPGGTRSWCLRKYEGGTITDLIQSSWTEATGTYRLKVTRDSSGNFEMFVDGASMGTATDTFLPTANYIVLRVDDDNSSAMDNLEVY